MNNTRLLQFDQTFVSIPNKNLLDANLVNYSIQVNDIVDRTNKGFEIGFQALMEEIKEAQDKAGIKDILTDEIMGGQEIVRYPITFQLNLNIVSPDIPMKSVNKRMKKLFDRWARRLNYRPYYFYNKYIFRQDTTVILIADKPQQVMDVYPEFLEDLYITVFEELHQEDRN